MTAPRQARLAVITDRLAIEQDGRVLAEPALGRLVEQLAIRFGPVELVASPWSDQRSMMQHDLSTHVHRFEPLPVMRSFAHGARHTREVAALIRAVEDRTDVSFVQLPFPAPLALLRQRNPRVYNVCADVHGGAIAAPQYQGLGRAAAIVAGLGIHGLHVLLTRRSSAWSVTNGAALLAKLRPAHGVASVSSVMRDEEIGSLASTPETDTLRVLFVGYLHPYKGVDQLLQAFADLLGRGVPATLRLVGALPLVERGVAQDIESWASRLAPHVEIVGQAPFGPELFGHYASSDVLVLPSLTEGTPRVLVEARAFGCVVVASDVGGVPSSIEDGVDGLLVPPRDPAAITDALERLAGDRALLSRLRAAGLERARSLTVERFAGVIGDAIDAALEGGSAR